MSTAQSNLSDSAFGYDLVVATTQKSINATMASFLDNLTAPEVIACYRRDGNGKIVPIAYDTLKQEAKGADPFTIPDGASANQDLKNLAAVGFVGAFKAQIGLPDMQDLSKLPPVVTLRGGAGAPVIFNLLCDEFEIAGFQDDGPGPHIWLHKSQQRDDPWYLNASVDIAKAAVQARETLPAPVQDRTKTLPNGSFGVDQLFLDLNTAIKGAKVVTFEGVPPKSPLASLVNEVFLSAYIQQMKKNGQPILGYSVTLTKPDQSTLQIGAVTRECCPLLDGSGHPFANPSKDQQQAATFNYLCTTSTTEPTAKPFTWNWVELGEVGDFSGVQAVRRDTFAKLLASALGAGLDGNFCIDQNVDWTKETLGVGYAWYPTFNKSGHCAFTQAAVTWPVDPNAFTPFLQLGWRKQPPPSATDWFGNGGMQCQYSITCDYQLAGTVSLSMAGDVPKIRIFLHATLNFMAQHWEITYWTGYNNVEPANYIDYQVTLDLPLTVTADGRITVELPNIWPQPTDNSASFYFSRAKGLTGGWFCDWIAPPMEGLIKTEKTDLSDRFKHIAEEVKSGLDGARGWVFPGGKSFNFTKVSFSNYLDLITHVTHT